MHTQRRRLKIFSTPTGKQRFYKHECSSTQTIILYNDLLAGLKLLC